MVRNRPETVQTLQHASFSAAHGKSEVAAFHARVMRKLDIHVISCKISKEELFSQCRKGASPVLQHTATSSDSIIGFGASALVDVLMESGSRLRLRENITESCVL
jgi:hypothetical protein